MIKRKLSKKIVIGNWKMNPTTMKEAQNLFSEILKGVLTVKKTELSICPPYIFLESFKKKSKKIILGAQNSFYEGKGAFTGEISTEMLFNIGVKYVILGHSERRALGESNTEVNKKIKNVLSFNLVPVVCFGESNRDENHEYLNFIKTQVEESLNGISKNLISNIVIAYEPIWAIGKSALREANPEEFLEMSIFIKKILSDKFGAKTIEGVRIIYGGSVHPENALFFLKDGKTDGFLVGRDSLNSKKFLEIIKITESL